MTSSSTQAGARICRGVKVGLTEKEYFVVIRQELALRIGTTGVSGNCGSGKESAWASWWIRPVGQAWELTEKSLHHQPPIQLMPMTGCQWSSQSGWAVGDGQTHPPASLGRSLGRVACFRLQLCLYYAPREGKGLLLRGSTGWIFHHQ